jgi:hypothetical protein
MARGHCCGALTWLGGQPTRSVRLSRGSLSHWRLEEHVFGAEDAARREPGCRTAEQCEDFGDELTLSATERLSLSVVPGVGWRPAL